MMSPTVVLRDGGAELVLGSAGSNRIRSAILQTIVGVVDHGLRRAGGVDAPRVHFEDGVVYAEPGIDVDALEAAGRTCRRFRAPQPVLRRRRRRSSAAGRRGFSGGGDPRRGGAAVVA